MPPDYSFCIITDGRRPRKLRREIESIQRLGFADCEILVGGVVPPGLPGICAVPLEGDARAGRLGAMRNALVARARGERLVVCDDDLVFHPDFRAGVERCRDAAVLAVRVLNPDGSRYWDWCTSGGPRGHRLLPYGETDPWVYACGCLSVIRADVARAVRWDDERGFYEAEDVEFASRLRAAGHRIVFCPDATVTHDDHRYRQRGVRVTRQRRLAALRHRVWSRARGAFPASWRAAFDETAGVPDTPLTRRGLVFVTGMERCGSRWVSAALATLSALPYADEPPRSAGACAPRDGLATRLADAHDPRRAVWTDRLATRLGLRHGAVVRWVSAPLAVGGLVGETGGRALVLLRHPCALLASWQELGWGPERALAALRAGPRGAELAAGPTARSDPHERFGAAWGVLYDALTAQADRGGWCVATYEDLCRDPEAGFRDVLTSLGVRPRQRGWRFIERHDRPPGRDDTPFALDRVAARQPDAWRERLDPRDAEACTAGASSSRCWRDVYGPRVA